MQLLNLLTGDFRIDINFEELLDKTLLPASSSDRHMLNAEPNNPNWASDSGSDSIGLWVEFER